MIYNLVCIIILEYGGIVTLCTNHFVHNLARFIGVYKVTYTTFYTKLRVFNFEIFIQNDVAYRTHTNSGPLSNRRPLYENSNRRPLFILVKGGSRGLVLEKIPLEDPKKSCKKIVARCTIGVRTVYFLKIQYM